MHFSLITEILISCKGRFLSHAELKPLPSRCKTQNYYAMRCNYPFVVRLITHHKSAHYILLDKLLSLIHEIPNRTDLTSTILSLFIRFTLDDGPFVFIDTTNTAAQCVRRWKSKRRVGEDPKKLLVFFGCVAARLIDSNVCVSRLRSRSTRATYNQGFLLGTTICLITCFPITCQALAITCSSAKIRVHVFRFETNKNQKSNHESNRDIIRWQFKATTTVINHLIDIKSKLEDALLNVLSGNIKN